MDIELPDLPDTNDILVPPNTSFDVPVADVPFLDPALLPSLEQIKSGIAEEEAISEKEEEKETEDVNALPPSKIPLNIPNNNNNLVEQETIGTFNIPLFGEFPVPAPEVIASSVIAAGTASVVSVAGGVAMQAVLGQIKKIFKKIFTKVLKKEVAEVKEKLSKK